MVEIEAITAIIPSTWLLSQKSTFAVLLVLRILLTTISRALGAILIYAYMSIAPRALLIVVSKILSTSNTANVLFWLSNQVLGIIAVIASISTKYPHVTGWL